MKKHARKDVESFKIGGYELHYSRAEKKIILSIDGWGFSFSILSDLSFGKVEVDRSYGEFSDGGRELRDSKVAAVKKANILVKKLLDNPKVRNHFLSN